MVDHSSGNEDKPYEILSAEKDYEIRLFRNEDPKQLYWHRDKENRSVELVYGDVEIQFDNKMPQKLYKGIPIKIKEGIYHRVLSEGMFILKIYKGEKHV